jgi:hypothetical protein
MALALHSIVEQEDDIIFSTHNKENGKGHFISPFPLKLSYPLSNDC